MPHPTDESLEQVIGTLLRAGVILAAVVVLIGGGILLTRSSHRRDYHAFTGEPAHLRNVFLVVKDAGAFHGEGVIQLGLLLLILTPIARVVFSVFGFAFEGDRMYVMITLIVLAVLLYSLFWLH